MVRAHLARYQRGGHAQQGSATVSFGLDGSGRVTRVSVVRGSGHASLDQEAAAMVRRASPFPPPPPGAARSFTVPVRFAVR
jgi:TonB family protein